MCTQEEEIKIVAVLRKTEETDGTTFENAPDVVLIDSETPNFPLFRFPFSNYCSPTHGPGVRHPAIAYIR